MVVTICLVTVLGVGIITWQRHKLTIEQERYEALRLLLSGRELAKRGEVGKAIDAYAKAQNVLPKGQILADVWNELCWYGTLWGYGTEVMNTCERAVQLDPKQVSYRDSRGVARALTGDFNGAIEDFQAFIDRGQPPAVSTSEKLRRKRWVDELRAGRNPFTDDELRKLRVEEKLEKDS